MWKGVDFSDMPWDARSQESICREGDWPGLTVRIHMEGVGPEEFKVFIMYAGF
jgi:hypothetical protein